MRRAVAALALLLSAASALYAVEQVVVTRDAFLMGTRARLATIAATRAEGLTTLEAALATLEETEAELSTWRADSLFSRINRAPLATAVALPARTCQLVASLGEWQRATDAAFDPAIGRLLDAWDIHGEGRVPTATQKGAALANSGLSGVQFDQAACTAARLREVTLDAGAFGKGEALDRAADLLRGRAWLIDLGGQVSVGAPAGERWPVDIAHPHDRDSGILRLSLSSGSLATSGGSERDKAADHRRIGHILDPRSGEPAAFTGSVTVWAERALPADILSTALYVMGRERGVAWAESRGIAALYLEADGDALQATATRAWRARFPLPDRD